MREFPAMVWTANAFLLDTAESQGGAAVRAMFGRRSVASGLVAINDQFLAQNLDRLDRLLFGQFGHRCDRLPVAPQEIAGRRPWSNASQEFIFFTLHGRFPSMRAFRRLFSCVL